MATMIAVYDSDGCQGRCDARCYNAKQPDCQCICHGINHGAGVQKAVENTRAMAEEWIDRARAANQDIVGARVSARTLQLGLEEAS